MTGPFGWLVTRCEAVKNAFGTRYFGVDACMANLMRPGMYGSCTWEGRGRAARGSAHTWGFPADHHITVPAREGGQARALANVVGTLCENNDWFCKERDLPADAGVGDLFVIHDTGAHRCAAAAQQQLHAYGYGTPLSPPSAATRWASSTMASCARPRCSCAPGLAPSS